MASCSPPLIIGVGNEYRSDDGVGLEIVRRLRAKPLPNTTIIEETGEGTALIEIWKDSDRVILFDAVSTGAVPGTIHRFEAHTYPIPARFFRSSTHTFGVVEAIELARALNSLPSHFLVYGIEGKNFEAGVGLSPEVERAAQNIVEQVVKEVA
ncbi:MAG: hydrogenase maturation protease [Candidatus Tectomicrobia bacterium]|nr:hydrogenase maturation protease [Candidatus Tectomicrobia bacterium]